MTNLSTNNNIHDEFRNNNVLKFNNIFNNITKSRKLEQTIFNYIAQINGFNVRLLSPTWNLVGMHKTELFSMNWQSLIN